MTLIKHVLSILLVMGLSATSKANEPVSSTLLKGTPIGSISVDYDTGRQSTTVNTPACAFDGDLKTFYASYDKSHTWAGLDLGTPHVITRVGWSPRDASVGPGRVQLALFEGSNSEDFLDAVPLYLIPETGTIGTMHRADVNVSRGFRYVRYVGPESARCNIAELEFWGYEGEGDDSQFYQVTNLPTISIHTFSGKDPQDKVNELESNITVTYDNGTRIQEYPVLTRCRGNASLGFPKKPYRFKFNDGKSHHMLKDSPLESPAKAKKWTLINNYGDKTLMRNILAFEASRRLDMPYTVWCQPVDVIMNGEYKGCYQLCDQISIDPNRVNITEMEPWDTSEPELTGGYLVEVDAYSSGEPVHFQSNHGNPVSVKAPDSDEIVAEQKNYIKGYFNLFEDALFGNKYTDDEEGYRKYLDVESFLANFLVGEFSGNTDTYWSTYMYKDRNQEQFFVSPAWDFDLAFANDRRIHPINSKSDWIFRSGGSCAGNMRSTVSRIIDDPKSAKRMKQIWKAARADGRFTKEGWNFIVDSIAQRLDASQKLNFIRWPILNQNVHQNISALGSFEAEVKWMRDYIDARIDWMDNKLNTEDPAEDSTFNIRTPQQLIEFMTNVKKGGNGSNAYLKKDIDMTGYSDKFSPIGTSSYPFKGTFDGEGHVIKNLKVKGTSYVGLFGIVTGGATIRNFVFDKSCSISGSAFLGVVGGSNGGGQVTLECIGNEANVTGTAQNASGLFGVNMSSQATLIVRNCYNAGTIVGGRESGALTGWGSNGTFENCYNIGTVSGADTGGRNYIVRGTGKLVNCYSTTGSQGIIISKEKVESGELCYLLNGKSSIQPVWRQTLGEDDHPVLFSNHKAVYFLDNTYTNAGTEIKLGDANADGETDQADLVAVKEFILGRTPERFLFDAADMNKDNAVNVFDLIRLIDLVNEPSLPDNENPSGLQNRITVNGFRITAGNTKTITALCSMSQPFTGFQMDITFPDGLTANPESFVMGALKGESHVIEAAQVGSVMRVLGYSLDNALFAEFTGNLFTFDVTASETFSGGTMKFGAQKMGSPLFAEVEVADASCNVSLATTLVREIILEADTFQLDPGQHLMLTATVLPTTATKKGVTWSIGDPSIATVSAEGELVGVDFGFTEVTATAVDTSKKTATAVVVVGDPSGIEAIDNGQWIIDNSDVYTLTGIRVKRPRKGGVYIVNGKKLIK